MKKISIIIPTYNHATHLPYAIDSVLNQSYQDCEIIIINDGSKDNTEGIINRYKNNSKIIYLKQENRGPSAARNKGISLAKGEYIIFLDSDDYFLPSALENIIRALEIYNPEAVVVRYLIIKKKGSSGIPSCSLYKRDNSSIIEKRNNIYLYDAQSYKKTIALMGHSLHISSVCLKREVLNKVGVFDETFPPNEDLELWDRVFFNIERFCFVDKVLTVWNSYLMYFEDHSRTKVKDFFLKEQKRHLKQISLLNKNVSEKPLARLIKRRLCSKKFKTKGIMEYRSGSNLKAIKYYLKSKYFYGGDKELNILMLKCLVPRIIRNILVKFLRINK